MMMHVWLGEKSWLASVPAIGIAATAENRSEALRRVRRMYEYAGHDVRDLTIVDSAPPEENE
jgi:hypothetical protein